jgi:NAD-dependent deacetylase
MKKPEKMTPEDILEAARRLNAAQLLVVLTGAGVSKESGVPTFRDVLDGLWARYDPQQLATPAAFLADPKLVWDWYAFRRHMIEAVKPNAGHYAIAELEDVLPQVLVVTQNIDGLHHVGRCDSLNSSFSDTRACWRPGNADTSLTSTSQRVAR